MLIKILSNIFPRNQQNKKNVIRTTELIAQIRAGKHEDVSASVYDDNIKFTEPLAVVCKKIGIEYSNARIPDKSLQYLLSALEQGICDAELYFYLALGYEDIGETDKAIHTYGQCLRLQPDYVRALNNLGVLCLNEGDIENAETNFLSVLTLDNEHVQASYNLGYIRDLQSNYDEALKNYRAALKGSPAFASARFNKSVIELLMREYQSGWSDFRARPSALYDERIPEAVILDSNLQNKKILLLSEMGIGDEIFFLRFAKCIHDRGGKVHYLANEKLACVLEHYEFVDRIISEWPDASTYDYVLSVADLPYALQITEPSLVTDPVPISVSRELVIEAKKVLSEIGEGPYIGITWRAGIPHMADGKPWKLLDKCLEPGELIDGLSEVGRVIPVQREITLEEKGKFPNNYRALFDFLDTAFSSLDRMVAFMMVLDEYVCVSNTHFYLRQSAGRDSHVLIVHPPEWRWNVSGNSDWFRGIPQYRLHEGNDLDAVLPKLVAELKTRINGI